MASLATRQMETATTSPHKRIRKYNKNHNHLSFSTIKPAMRQPATELQNYSRAREIIKLLTREYSIIRCCDTARRVYVPQMEGMGNGNETVSFLVASAESLGKTEKAVMTGCLAIITRDALQKSVTENLFIYKIASFEIKFLLCRIIRIYSSA